MHLYQTKVSDKQHEKLEKLGKLLYSEQLIKNNSKYEITKFALNILIDMFDMSKNEEVLPLDR